MECPGVINKKIVSMMPVPLRRCGLTCWVAWWLYEQYIFCDICSCMPQNLQEILLSVQVALTQRVCGWLTTLVLLQDPRIY